MGFEQASVGSACRTVECFRANPALQIKIFMMSEFSLKIGSQAFMDVSDNNESFE